MVKIQVLMIDILFILILCPFVLSQQTIFNDSFNRGDSTTLGNNWWESNAGTGDCSISSNTMICTAGTNVAQARHNITMGEGQGRWTTGDNISASVFMTFVGGGMQFDLAQTADDGPWVRLTSTTLDAYDKDAGTWVKCIDTVAGRGYNVTILNMNFSDLHFDVLVNNTLCNNAGAHHKVFGTITQINYVQLRADTGAGNNIYDEIYIKNLTLASGPAPPPTPTLTISTNILNNTVYNTDPLLLRFNGTVQYTNDNNFNCTLTRSLSTYAYTTSLLNINISRNQNFSINTSDYTIFDGTGTWEMNISCSNNNVTASVVRTNLTVDLMVPTINLRYNNNATEFENNTVLYRSLGYPFNITVNYADQNLYATNTTIFLLKPDGTDNASLEWWFYDGVSSPPSKPHQGVNLTLFDTDWMTDPSFPDGNYVIRSQAWDSHTASAINEYLVNDVAEKITIPATDLLGELIRAKEEVPITGKRIMDAKTGSVLIYSDSLKEFDMYKQPDRYTFDMAFAEQDPYVYVQCEDPQIIEKSEYKGHIVCFKEKKWIDFEDNDLKQVPQLEKIDENTVRVRLIGVKPDQLMTFNSIGDLNTATKNTYFSIQNVRVISAYDYDFYIENITSKIYGFTADVYYPNGTVYMTGNASADGNMYLPIASGIYNVSINATNYNRTTVEINFSSTANKSVFLSSYITMYITFKDYLGNVIPMTGIIGESPSTFNMTNQLKIGIDANDIALGKDLIYFNGVNGKNWTQYYEWDNTGTTSGSFSLYKLQKADMISYFRVRDTSASNVEDAEIQIYYSYSGASSDSRANFTLFGQRLSDTEGIGLFWLDSDSMVKVIVNKDGYYPITKIMYAGDMEYNTKDNAMILYISSTSALNATNLELIVPFSYKATNTNISGTLNVYVNGEYRYSTDYSPSLKEFNENWWTNQYGFTLQNGTDYVIGSNVTFNLYMDNVLLHSQKITYIQPATEIASLSGLDNELSYPLLFIALIIVSVLIGTLIAGNSAGAMTFRIGTVVLAAFQPAFLNLALINVIYMMFRLLYKNISE